MKFRFRLACNHWTSVLDEDAAAAVRSRGCIDCDKCQTERVGVIKERRLKDTAKLPTEDRHSRRSAALASAADLRGAIQQRDVAARHWKVP